MPACMSWEHQAPGVAKPVWVHTAPTAASGQPGPQRSGRPRQRQRPWRSTRVTAWAALVLGQGHPPFEDGLPLNAAEKWWGFSAMVRSAGRGKGRACGNGGRSVPAGCPDGNTGRGPGGCKGPMAAVAVIGGQTVRGHSSSGCRPCSVSVSAVCGTVPRGIGIISLGLTRWQVW